MKTHKALIITASDLSQKHAPTTRMANLCTQLNKTSLPYQILAPQPKGNVNLPNSTSCIFFKTPHFKGFKSIVLQMKFFLHLALHRPDMVYFRHSTAMFAPAAAALILRIPSVMEMHGLAADNLNKTSMLKKMCANLSQWINVKTSRNIIAVSSGIKHALEQKYSISLKKTCVVPSAVNIDEFCPDGCQLAKKTLKLDPENDYLVFIGSMNWWQGTEFAVESLAHILIENEKTKLLFAGDGPTLEATRQTAVKLGIADKVIFAGNIDYELVPTYINAATICLLPKRPIASEYSPVKLYEYMACARPVVASRLPGLEIVEEFAAGKNFAFDNRKEFAQAVNSLLEDEALRVQTGENGRKLVEDRFSWKQAAQNILSVIQKAER